LLLLLLVVVVVLLLLLLLLLVVVVVVVVLVLLVLLVLLLAEAACDPSSMRCSHSMSFCIAVKKHGGIGGIFCRSPFSLSHPHFSHSTPSLQLLVYKTRATPPIDSSGTSHGLHSSTSFSAAEVSVILKNRLPGSCLCKYGPSLPVQMTYTNRIMIDFNKQRL
jgi:hypothetical protein